MLSEEDSSHRTALTWSGDRYYRHAGAWGVNYHKVDGKMLTWGGQYDHMDGRTLVPCTKEEWLEDNKGYVRDEDRGPGGEYEMPF